MIPVDILDATPAMGRALDEAVRLIEAVRSTGKQSETLKFLTHVRSVARETDEAMAAAILSMGAGDTLDDSSFARVYAAGCSHSAMVAFCESLAGDPMEAVRLAGAAGAYVLGQIARSPEHARVILAIQKRLDQAA